MNIDLISFLVVVCSYLYILSDIGLRRFCARDVWKLIFPLYLYVYLKGFPVRRIYVVCIHVVAILTWIAFGVDLI